MFTKFTPQGCTPRRCENLLTKAPKHFSKKCLLSSHHRRTPKNLRKIFTRGKIEKDDEEKVEKKREGEFGGKFKRLKWFDFEYKIKESWIAKKWGEVNF